MAAKFFHKLAMFHYLLIIVIVGVNLQEGICQTNDPNKFIYDLEKVYNKPPQSNNARYKMAANEKNATLEIIIEDNRFYIMEEVEGVDQIRAVVVTYCLIAKVLKPEGVTAADITTPLYYKEERSSTYDDRIVVRGRTRTPDGEIIEMDPKEVSEIKTSVNYRQKIFSLPGVEKGAWIQYEYEITYRYQNEYSSVFNITNSFPVRFSRYYFIVPLKWEVKFGAYPNITLPPPAREKSPFMMTQPMFHWDVTQMIPGEEDDYMPSSSVSDTRLYFSVVDLGGMMPSYRDNWNDYGRKILWKAVKSKIKGSREINAIVKKLKKEAGSSKKIAERVYYYIQNQYQVTSKRALPSQEANETFDEKEGSSADLAVLYHEMLKKVEIRSVPALLRSKYRGNFPKEPPMIDWFDNMLLGVLADDDTMWVDLSSRTSKFGTLPENSSGVEALVISKDEAKFIQIPSVNSESNHKITNFTATLQEDGYLQASCFINYGGEYDRLIRNEYKNLYKKEIRDKIRRKIQTYFPEAVLKDNWKVLDVRDYDTNFAVFFDFDVPQFINQKDSLVFLQPFLLTNSKIFPELPNRPRKHPIDLSFSNRQITKVTWNIPNSFEIVSLPKPMDSESKFARYNSIFTVEGNTITAERTVNLKTNMIKHHDFDTFREFGKKIRMNGNSKIILKRKAKLTTHKKS